MGNDDELFQVLALGNVAEHVRTSAIIGLCTQISVDADAERLPADIPLYSGPFEGPPRSVKDQGLLLL